MADASTARRLVLVRRDDSLGVTREGWRALRELAVRFGDYRRNTIGPGAPATDARARAFAAALRRALPDVPHHDALPGTDREPSVLELLSGPRRTQVEGVAAFAEGGGFRVRLCRCPRGRSA